MTAGNPNVTDAPSSSKKHPTNSSNNNTKSPHLRGHNDDATASTKSISNNSSTSHNQPNTQNHSTTAHSDHDDDRDTMAALSSSSSFKVPSTVVTPDRASNNKGSNSSNSQTKKHAKTAQDWKDEGNDAYGRKKWRQALEAYDNGLSVYYQTNQPPQNNTTFETTTKTNDTSQQQQDHENDKAVLHSLLSNRAIALFKLEQFTAAEEACTRLLDQHEANVRNNPEYTPPSKLFKVWFRRAAARESIAKGMLSLSSTSSSSSLEQHQQAHELLKQARVDLRTCLDDLEHDKVISEKERNETKDSVSQCARRIQRLLVHAEQHQPTATTNQNPKQPSEPNNNNKAQQQPDPPSITGSGQPRSKTDAPGRTADSLPKPLPPIKNQKQDVMRLFMSRQMALQKHQPPKAAAIHGEAFFLMDWQWWRHFCHFIDLFGSHQQKVLSYMPHGASVPEPLEKEDDDEENDNRIAVGPPGPIDNSSLFLLPLHPVHPSERTTQQVFNEQWYAQDNNNEGEHKNEPRLKPNLVRGYHYEIIPREVYSALREWYGSGTPAICRRAERNQRTGLVSIPLYLGGNNSAQDKKYNLCGACQTPLTTNLRCQRCKAVHYCDRGCQENHWPLHKQECRSTREENSEKDDSNKDAPTSPPPQQTIRGYPRSYGRVGLNNLGNTCFMNSAVQCLSHATPLTRYFLSGKFRSDINPHNALGTGGKLAAAYETVMKDLWMRGAGIRSTSPTALKRAIANFAPRFAGCLQHDAQEFLAYLLDGLHEDLNRIRKAPYVEMPDFKEGQDMAVAGARAWDAHKRRNDSLLQDTFYGQFKSTCVCPQCSRVSVSFDAFNHVSLEIPQQQNALVTLGVLVVKECTPEHPGSLPTRYAVQVRRNNPVSELKQEVSKLTGVPAARFALCISEDRDITQIFRDDEMISTVKMTDLLVAYEIEPFEGPTKTIRPSFHAILRHKIVSNKNNTAAAAPRMENEDDDFLGIPLLTSWPADWTCKEIWEYLWNAVSDKVDPNVHQQYKDSVGFRVHNGRDRGVEAFPDLMENLQDGEPARRTSLLPRYSSQTMLSFLGQRALEDFVLMWVEWTDLEETEEGEGQPQQPPEEAAATEASKKLKLDEDRFVAVENDESWMDAIAKRRSQQNKGISLNECFETFTKPERLDERNTWYCSNCKEHVCAMKTMELSKLPNILVVHLKRFEFRNVLRRDKLDTLVDFPLEGLDMSEHCVAGQQQGSPSASTMVDDHVPAMYDLFAVVNHYGRMGFGHYTAFARNWDERGISPDWQLFDDSSVGSDTESIVSPAAYVLFYRRRTWN